MRKLKFLSVILAFMVFLGAFWACNPENSSSQDSTAVHTCESVCEECGKCLDAECMEEACEDKCAGHTVEPAPTHTCESVCPTCNKCTDTACTEEACADKCAGHHTCESKCPTCNKCTDTACTEAVCEDKCAGHTVEPAPTHTCESVCPTCNKCTDTACTEEACADKCAGHTVEPAPTHTCESKCPTCNKCLDTTCTEEACEDKCAGHTVEPSHTCESVCETCGGCTDIECTEEVCESKCSGHTVEPEHTACESVCPECGKCTDMICREEFCQDKCLGHTIANPNWDAFELSFMSFNINWAASSPTADTGVTSWGNRKEAVLDFINNSGAHIIGLQEVAEWKADSVNQVLYLQNNLASNYELVYFGKDTSLGIVYDKTVFNLVSQEHYWLSATPDVKSPCWGSTTLYRLAAILILEHKETGEIIRAINTHGPLSDEINVKCFNLIAERSLSNENNPITVMTGDFNATPNKLGYVPIAEKLQDCRYSAEESRNRDCRTWNGYSDTEKGILDYCFVTKRDNVKVTNFEVGDHKFGDGYYLADHFAVQATVRIYNNSEKAWTGFY